MECQIPARPESVETECPDVLLRCLKNSLGITECCDCALAFLDDFVDAILLVFNVLLVAQPVQVSVERHERLNFFAREEADVELEPLIHGGGQERGLRSGTENVAGIVGMGEAAEQAMADMDERRDRLTDLRDEFVATVQDMTGAELIGHPDYRLPGYAMLCFSGRSGSQLITALAERDIAVSGGSACHSGDPSPSRVLIEMGIDRDLALGAVRLSMGRATTRDDVESVTEALQTILHDLPA